MKKLILIIAVLVGAMTLTGCASTRCEDIHGNQKSFLFGYCNAE
nr:hypothetical protein [uncultured Haemophilus sp.]